MAKRAKEVQTIPKGTFLPRRAELPQQEYPLWPIECPGPREKMVRAILSREALILQTHYLHLSRTRKLCTEKLCGQCEHHHKAAVDTYCYLACFRAKDRANTIIAVPRSTASTIPAIINDEPLFNRELMIERIGFGKTGPLKARISLHELAQQKEEQIVEWPYLLKILLNIFRIDLRYAETATVSAEEMESEAKRRYWASLREKRREGA
jgi:hypothetical protein